METSPIRIMLCESRLVVGEALGGSLARIDGIECLGVAKTYWAARKALEAVRPDAILVTLDFHEAELRALIGESAGSRVVFLSSPLTTQMLLLQEDQPSFTVVSSAAPLADLVENLKSGAGGDLLGDDVPTDHLSPREFQTLSLLVEGMTPTEIGEHLFVSIHTVRFHIKALLAKLEVNSQAAAIVAGIERGLVSAPPRANHLFAEAR